MTTFNGGKIKNLIDRIQQYFTAVLRHFGVFALQRIQFGVQQQFGHAEHAI